MKKVLRKSLSFSVGLYFLMVGVIGCSQNNGDFINRSNDQSSNQKVTIDVAIHVANPKGQEAAFYQTVQKFMEKNPNIEVNLQGTEQKAHIKKIKMMAQSDTLPDIFWILPASAKELEEAGMLLDLTDFLNENRGIIEKFHSNMLNPYQLNGSQFGLPYQSLVTGFWYNKALFDQYGVKLPETYTDLIEAVKIFEENNVIAIAKGSRDPYSVWAFLTMLSRYGYFDKIDNILAGEESYNNEEFLKFYKKIAELRELGAFPENVAALSYFHSVQMFLNGEAAMLDAGVWETKKIEESPIANDVGFWWGPTFSDGVGNQQLSSIVPAAPLVVSKKVEDDEAKYEAVMKFLKFYYSEEGAQIMLENQVPPMIKFKGEIDQEKHPVFAKVIEQMNNPDWTSQPNQPDLIVPEPIANAINDSIYGVINGIYTPEEALNVVDKKMNGH
ncbi:ABC transporter substrate-binding protein [Bacillus taeanensis]|uniref:Carbohydrate ABC transporter substrate-binding protein n=1 Tax=Bacillus taeanensis TaxID=273032 RepID=A0A366XYV3_9BACI|nr:extracellular solute-binding protein [Bacillus taeanensis]RBW70786.1 hypothetical protein DS031_04735 [Bacillus taeanensis]